MTQAELHSATDGEIVAEILAERARLKLMRLIVPFCPRTKLLIHNGKSVRLPVHGCGVVAATPMEVGKTLSTVISTEIPSGLTEAEAERRCREAWAGIGLAMHLNN